VNLYNPAAGTLSIGELGHRTGVGVSTLRAWESRHGFPVAQRLPSGHRRYSEQDVEAVLTVARERRAGSTLDAALTRARDRIGRQRSSIFATLSNALPNVAPVVLSKRAMLAISRAIEDEAATRADHPLFVGAFQEPRFWRASADRWAHLIGGADAAVVLGAFRHSRRRADVFEVAVPSGAPVLREWAVVCESSSFSACLVGIEQIGTRPTVDGRRRFEALWTVEPLAVREAARSGFALGIDHFQEVGASIGTRLQEPAQATYDPVRVATAITNRIVAYMDGGHSASRATP
jgi:DICT domain-containing protein